MNASSGTSGAEHPRAIVDCDVHNVVESPEALYPYLSGRWRRHLEMFGLNSATGAGYPRPPGSAGFMTRGPAAPDSGAELSLLRGQLLDPFGIVRAILIPLSGAGNQRNLELDAALSRAVNDWQVARWLDPEPRLRASIVVPYEDAQLAVAEIERRAADRRFVQVQFLGRPCEPIGRKRYWPIYAAAERHGLPVCSHAFGSRGLPITGAGWPSLNVENQVGSAQAMQAQVISLVLEGVFERFPGLKIVSAENGFGWVPALTWRLDASWALLKDEVPDLRRTPSEYVHDHFWFCAQPMDGPPNPEHLARLIDDIGVDRLLFASNYPRGELARLEDALPPGLLAGTEQRILSGNARDLYGDRL